MSKKRLGKGLGALISTQGGNSAEKDKLVKGDNNIIQVPLDSISPNPYQPRKKFDQQELEELSQSIKEHGLIQPIIVRTVDDSYQIVAGERRYRAAKKLGLDDIKAIVSEFDEQQMMEIALIENLQRQELNPIEEAEAYQKLIDKFNLVQAEVARRVGKSRSAISNSLRLLKLPNEIKENVSRGTLSMGHARALLGVVDIDLQQEIAKKVIEEDLTVRETEKLVKEINKGSSEKKEQDDKKEASVKKKDANLNFVEDKLRKVLGTKVDIKTGKKKGKIVIEYYSKDDLERIIEILGD